MYRPTIRLALILSLACGLMSCTNKVNSINDGKVQIQLPTQDELRLFTKTHRGLKFQAQTQFWGQPEPVDLSEINCFAVFFQGPESSNRRNTCTDSIGKLVANPGNWFGGYLPGQSVTISVPSGQSRTISIIGIKSSDSSACLNARASMNTANFSSPWILGSTTQDLAPGDHDLAIGISFSKATQFQKCTGPDFDGVVKTPDHPVAASLQWLTPPSTTTAGSSWDQIRIAILDAAGNIVSTGPDSTASIALQIQQGAGPISGTLTKAAVNGIVSFTSADNLRIDLAGNKVIQATKGDTRASGGSGSLSILSPAFEITHAIAHQIVFVSQPFDGVIVGEPLLLSMEIRDAHGNLVTSGTDSTAPITLSLQYGSGTLTGTVTKPASGGIAQFTVSDQVKIDTHGSKSLSATKADRSTSGGTSVMTAMSSSFQVVAAGSPYLSFITQPAMNSTAGERLKPVIEIRDSNGQRITTGPDSTATITLSLAQGTGTLSGVLTKTAIAGVATFDDVDEVFIDLVGIKVIRAEKQDTSLQGGLGTLWSDSSFITVKHAPASQMVFVTQPAQTELAGRDLLPILEIRDPFGNLVTTGADATAEISLSLAVGTGTLKGRITKPAVGGIVAFQDDDNVNLELTGQKTLRATKPNLVGSGGTSSLFVDSDPFHVYSNEASQLVFSMQPANAVAAGSPLLVALEIRDQYGNLSTIGPDSNAFVTLSLHSGTGTLSGTLTKAAVAGVASFTIDDDVVVDLVGNKVLRATKADMRGSGGAATLNTDSNSFTIAHGPATQIVFTTPPSSVISLQGFSVVAEIRDARGNVVTSGADASASVNVALSSQPDSLLNAACGVTTSKAVVFGGTTSVTASAGVATFTGLTLNVAGNYVMSATKATTAASGTLIGLSPTFALGAGQVTALYWKDAAGTTIQPNSTRLAGQNFDTGGVIACDGFGNTATNSTNVVEFSIVDTDINPNPTNDHIHGVDSGQLVNGALTFSMISASIYKAASNYYLIATDLATGVQSPMSSVIAISPNAWTKLEFLTVDSTWPNGLYVIPEVIAQVADDFGNLRTTGCSGNATLSLSTNPDEAGTLDGTLTVAQINCIYRWPAVRVSVPATTSGFQVSATTDSALCNGGTTTCSGTNEDSFTVTTDPGLNLVHAFDLLDGAAGCIAKNGGGAQVVPFTVTPFNPSWFSGTTTYQLEVVVTNDSTSTTRAITLSNSSGTVFDAASIAIGPSVQRMRYVSTITPTSGITNYRLRMSVCGSNTTNLFRVHSARVLVTQSNNNAYGTTLHIPLIQAPATQVEISGKANNPVDSTTSTVATQGIPANHSIWEYDASLFERIRPNSGVKFYAILSSTTAAGTAYAELWNKTTNTLVTGTTLSAAGKTTPFMVESAWLPASTLTTGNDYEVRIRTNDASVAAKIHKAGLLLKVESMTKYATHWRVSPTVSATTTDTYDQMRTNFDQARFSPSTVSFECTGSSNGPTVDLVSFGNTNSGGTVTAISGSTISLTPTKDLLRATGLTLPTGANSYGIRTNVTSGTVDVSGCRVVIAR
jgi:hypothetical protein